jgi:lysophospholipase L1-like esterase
MIFKRSRWFTAVGVCAGMAACGGSKTAPTPTSEAPSIACPVAPDPVDSLDGSAQVVSFPAPTVTGGQAPLTTSCTPVSGSSFVIGTTTVTCTTADARARTASCTFPVVVQPPPKLPVTSFLAFGDSLTWGEDGRDTASALDFGQRVFVQVPQSQRYPDILQQELQARYRQQQVSVMNAGCPGESLSDPGDFKNNCFGERADDPSAFRRFTSIASLHRWDAVLFMEGSNDADMASGDSRVLPVAIDYLRKMIEDAKGRGMQVIVGTIPPMVPPGALGRAKGAAVVPTFNDMVRALATSEGVPVADVYQAFGADAPTLIGFDGLHPNPAGYQRMADSFFDTIKSALETRASATRVKTNR